MPLVTIYLQNEASEPIAGATISFVSVTATTIITGGDGMARLALSPATYAVSATSGLVTKSFGTFKMPRSLPATASGLSAPSGTSPVRFQNSKYEHGDVSVDPGNVKLHLRF